MVAVLHWRRGKMMESIFGVDAPFEKTLESLKEWNGTKHSDLKVYLHGDLAGAGSPADYAKLISAPANASVRALVAATEKLAPDSKELQMSAAEAAQAPKKSGGGGPTPPAQIAIWAELLG